MATDDATSVMGISSREARSVGRSERSEARDRLGGDCSLRLHRVSLEPGSYLRLPAVGGLVLALLSLPLAVVPALRAASGSPSHRALVTIGFWVTYVVIFVLVGTATR